jgi:hypothetical protein
MFLLPKKSAVCNAFKGTLKFTLPLISIKCLLLLVKLLGEKKLKEREYFRDIVADGRRILNCKSKEITDSR